MGYPEAHDTEFGVYRTGREYYRLKKYIGDFDVLEKLIHELWANLTLAF